MLKYMKLSDIIIPVAFKAHPPAEQKMEICREYMEEYDELDRRIVVSPDGVLLDGYVGYLILLEAGWDGVYVDIEEPQHVSYRSTETTYVAGVHAQNGREYWWRLTPYTQNIALAAPGNFALVATKHGPQVMQITKVETRLEPPVSSAVKKVLRCFANQSAQKEMTAHE